MILSENRFPRFRIVFERTEPVADDRHCLLEPAPGLVITALWIGEPCSVAMTDNEVYCAIGWIDRKFLCSLKAYLPLPACGERARSPEAFSWRKI